MNGVEHFHHYVFGKSFEVHTDHQPLVQLSIKPLAELSPRLQCLFLRVNQYKYTVKYVRQTGVMIAESIMQVEFDWHLKPLHCMPACLVEFGGHNLNGFTPNLTGQIGCKSIMQVQFDQHLKPLRCMPTCLVEFGGHNLNGFTPNLTGRIRPVDFDQTLITGQIG